MNNITFLSDRDGKSPAMENLEVSDSISG